MTTITVDRAVLEQALEALEWASDLNAVAQNHTPLHEAITALRAALEQQEQAITPAELSAALGWPEGISTPVLDKGELLRLVAQGRMQQEQKSEDRMSEQGVPFVVIGDNELGEKLGSQA